MDTFGREKEPPPRDDTARNMRPTRMFPPVNCKWSIDRDPDESQYERKSPFNQAPLQSRRLSGRPSLYSMRDPIRQWTAIGAVVPLEWSRDTNKFDFQLITRCPHDRVSVTT